MSHRRLSASSAERWVSCPASQVLPWAEEVTSDAAERGIAIHAFLERWSKLNDKAKALEGVPEQWRDFAESITEAAIDPSKYIREMVLGWKLSGASGSTVEDTPEWRDGWDITARLDAAAVDQETSIGYIEDDKTGRAWVPHAKNNWQMRVQAFLLATVYKLDSVHCCLRFHREDGTVGLSSYTFNSAEIAHIGKLLKATVAAVAEQQRRRTIKGSPPVDVHMGRWCDYCPAYNACPGKVGLLRALVEKPAGIEEHIKSLLTPENAGVAHDKLKQLEDLVERLRASIRDVADKAGGVRTSEGRIYGPIEVERRSLDGPVAAEVLADLFGSEVAWAAVGYSTTIGAVEEALKAVVKARKAKGEKVTRASLLQETLDAMDKAGGITVRRERRIQEHG